MFRCLGVSLCLLYYFAVFVKTIDLSFLVFFVSVDNQSREPNVPSRRLRDLEASNEHCEAQDDDLRLVGILSYGFLRVPCFLTRFTIISPESH